MDFSDRYTDEYLQLCCPFVDCAEISCGGMNEDEIYFLINKIISYGCKQMVIATRGNKGAIVFIDGKSYKQSPCLIEAIDTMGAGDSFITSFLLIMTKDQIVSSIFIFPWEYFTNIRFDNFSLEISSSILYILVLEIIMYVLYNFSLKNKNLVIS